MAELVGPGEIDVTPRSGFGLVAELVVRAREDLAAFVAWVREQQTPQAFSAYLKAEMDKWGAVVRESGIKAQ